jgi:hypothetical protein
MCIDPTFVFLFWGGLWLCVVRVANAKPYVACVARRQCISGTSFHREVSKLLARGLTYSTGDDDEALHVSMVIRLLPTLSRHPLIKVPPLNHPHPCLHLDLLPTLPDLTHDTRNTVVLGPLRRCLPDLDPADKSLLLGAGALGASSPSTFRRLLSPSPPSSILSPPV